MNMTGNRQVLLKVRPAGIPQAEHFEIVETPLAEPIEGQIVVRNHDLSVEPAMRGWVSSVGNYSEPVPIGGVMRAFAVGRVVASQRRCRAPGPQARHRHARQRCGGESRSCPRNLRRTE